MYYVNVYQRKGCYGGPEEGSWHYDAWEPIEQLDDDGNYYATPKYISRIASSESEAKQIKNYLENEYSYPSHCRTDSKYEVRIEPHPPEPSSNYKRYE
jgi:hypothetical protein